MIFYFEKDVVEDVDISMFEKVNLDIRGGRELLNEIVDDYAEAIVTDVVTFEMGKYYKRTNNN